MKSSYFTFLIDRVMLMFFI